MAAWKKKKSWIETFAQHFILLSVFFPQYRAWWMERYGNNSFNDDEEVQNLLTKKSVTDSISPVLETSGS